MNWIPASFDTASPAAQLFAAVFVGVVLTRLFRWVLAVIGIGS